MDDMQVLARLRDIASDAEREAAEEDTAIARRASAVGRLQSGYFYKAVQTDLQERFGLALQEMAGFATKATSRKRAAAALETAGGELRNLLLDHLRRTCDGASNGAALGSSATAGILERTSENLARQLRHHVSDVRNGIGAQQPGWLSRHGWEALGASIASASLILAWLALQ